VSSRPDSPSRFWFRKGNILTADSTARSIDAWNGFRGAASRVSIVVLAPALVLSTSTAYCASAEESDIVTNKAGAVVSEERQPVAEQKVAEQKHLAEQNQTSDQRHSDQKQHIEWQKWSNDIFEIAAKQNKHVLLDLEAVWCHWCHVMEAKTYHDPAIVKLVNTNYLPVKVDQDSRPDLSNRYEDYGWPATIVFSKDGKELQKLQGYIPVKEFLPILKAPESKRDNESDPDQSVAAANRQISSADGQDIPVDGQLTKAVQAELEQRHKDGYDTKNGGWGFGHKFLYRDTMEYSIGRARSGDKVEEKKAQETLKLEQQLLDPVWGGIYQYSTHNDWTHAHFEKIMEVQAGNMRIYSLAYLYWKDPTYLHVAEEIAGYLNTFLRSPDGAFYTSQDADVVPGKHSDKYFSLDDSKRRKQGIPRIDQHIYSRENGWVIQALIGLYQASGKSNYLQQAEAAADWIEQDRSLPGGGFKHDKDASAGPYLGDTLAMGRAFLALYTATGNRQWYERAEMASVFIHDHFLKREEGGPRHVAVGVMTGVPTNAADVTYNLDENVDVARFANLLYRYSGKENDKVLAQAAMRYLAVPKIALSRQNLVGGILLANAETSSEPVHITTVGKKSDAEAAKFFFTSQTFPSAYKRVDWFDEAEGALPNTDITYPKLAQSAAFLCGKNACSPPIRSTERLSEMMARISHPK
jgi:uncharacterized protein